MISTILSDFSRVLIFVREPGYQGSLNALYKEVSANPDFKFTDYFQVNHQLLQYYASLRHKFTFYLYTTSTLQDDPAVKPLLNLVFTKIYSAEKLHMEKDAAASYTSLAKKYIHRNPREIVFIDDQEKNIKAAKSAGYFTLHYLDNKQIIEQLGLFTKI